MLVWVASYPRSGNTFLRVILHQAFGVRTYSLHSDDLDIGADPSTSQIVGHRRLPEGWSVHQARIGSDLWAVKTHDGPVESDKTIYIIRDGREAALSYFKYLQMYTKQGASLVETIAGAVDFGGWSNHVLAWNPQERPNTLLLRFEELITDPGEHVRRIADFLELEPAVESLPSFDDLHRANPKFFRSGQTSSWIRVFDPDTHCLFWLLHHEAMTKYGYTDHIPEVLQPWLALRDQDVPSHPTDVVATLGELAAKCTRLPSEQLRERRHELHSQRREVHRLRTRLEEQTRDLEELRAHLAHLRSSRSWRCTRPFRGLAVFIRGLRS